MTPLQTHSILVVGCQGQVGQELLARGAAQGFSIAGLDLPDVDISDAHSALRAVETHEPGLVINAAAYTAVDKAESDAERALSVNADGPRHLARACASAQIPLFHISTDYVYDGANSTPYLEDDPIAPLGVYGHTKAAGDHAVRDLLKSHIILRTAWVYSPFGGNFVKTMLRLASEHDKLTVVDDQHGCPTAAGDIAHTLLTLARICLDDPGTMVDKWGTYHYCSSPATTWYGFAQAIVAKSAQRGGRNVPVVPIATADYPTPARRPVNSVLDCNKIEKTFGIKVRGWSDALDETLEQLMTDHRTGSTDS
jgi:dTDP-4-dehydrorhamnose reductase